jgi:hypothetical protein
LPLSRVTHLHFLKNRPGFSPGEGGGEFTRK